MTIRLRKGCLLGFLYVFSERLSVCVCASFPFYVLRVGCGMYYSLIFTFPITLHYS